MANFGYTDWRKTPTGISTPLIDDTRALNTNGTVLGTFLVTDYPNLAVTFANLDATAYNWIEFRWNTVNSFLAFSAIDKMSVGPGGTASFVLPCKGLWVEIVVFSDVATVGVTHTLVYGTVSELTPQPSLYHNPTVMQDVSNYAANQVIIIDALDWFGGPALVSAYSSLGGPATIRFKAWDPISKGHQYYAVFGIQKAESSVSSMLYIPPHHLRAEVTNDATAQSIAVFVTAAPGF
jgi:hypothetical protein